MHALPVAEDVAAHLWQNVLLGGRDYEMSRHFYGSLAQERSRLPSRHASVEHASSQARIPSCSRSEENSRSEDDEIEGLKAQKPNAILVQRPPHLLAAETPTATGVVESHSRALDPGASPSTAAHPSHLPRL